jgi:hypothetical protein
MSGRVDEFGPLNLQPRGHVDRALGDEGTLINV